MLPSESTLPLGDLCFYVKETCDCSLVDPETYVSTDSMLPDKAGITVAESIPTIGSVNRYQPKDILVSNIRPYFKKIWQSDRHGTCSNDVLVIRAKDERICDYLMALLSDDCFFEHMMLGSKGTKMPRGDKNQILTYPVHDLTLPNMLTIGNWCSIINKLIACIQLINDNLDAQVKALYSELFSEDRIVEYGRLGAYCDIQKGLSYKGSGLSESDGALLINLGNIAPGGGYRKDKEKYYTGDYNQKHIVQPGDLIIANTDMTYERAILGSSIIVPDFPGTILFTHHLFALRDLRLPQSYLYYYLRTDEFHGLCESSANGTTVLAISREDILDATIPIPNSTVLDAFDKVASVALEAMSQNVRETAKLMALRDYLLPKLISGEIDVSDISLPTKYSFGE